MTPLEQRMATSPNAEILNNIKGSPSPLPSISPTGFHQYPKLTTRPKTSPPARHHERGGSASRTNTPAMGTKQRGHVHWEPQVNAPKPIPSPQRPKSEPTKSPNKSQGMPVDVDLSSYEPPSATAKTKKPKIQVMIPKNKRPRPIFRKFSRDSDSKSSEKKSKSPDKISVGSARELLPKSGALVPAKAAAQLGITSKTPGLPAGMQLESLRTAPPAKDTSLQRKSPTAPVGPSPVIGPKDTSRAFTAPNVPTVPASTKSRVPLSDGRSFYEIPIPPQQHDPMPPHRPSQDTTDGSLESEGAFSDEGRFSDYSKRTSMTSLDSKDIPDGKFKGVRRSGRKGTMSNSPLMGYSAFPNGKGHARNVSEPKAIGNLANTRGVRLGAQMQERANSVPSPEKRRFEGAPAMDRQKRSLDERRPLLKRNEFGRTLESPGRKAFSVPSPERKGVYDNTLVKEKSERKDEFRSEAGSPKRSEKQNKQSIPKGKSQNNLNNKPLPPSPPPSALATLPDGNKSREKNVFDEKLELEVRRTQSQLSPSQKIHPLPRRSYSQRAQRNHARQAANSSLSHSTSNFRSRAGSRTRLDQLDRNFINASPKPDQTPRVFRSGTPTLSQAEYDLETHLTAISESPTYYFDHRFKTPEWEKSREQAQRYSSSDIPPIPLKSPRRTGKAPAPLVRKRSASAPPASPSQRRVSVKEVAAERQAVSADAAEQIIVRIMASLDTLEDLFTTAITNKAFYRIFKLHELDLMKQVLRNGCPAAWEHREFTPPNADQSPEDDLPVEDYTPNTYLECYSQDLQIIGGLKALILERCQSVTRPATAKALASTDPVVSRRMDAAFWRIWTFCVIFGAAKGREDDINGQIDWLRGGMVAHTQTCTHSIMGSESMDLNSVLLAAPPCFAQGNNPGKGLTSEELYDMTELWISLGALARGLHGRTKQARKFGIFDGTKVKKGDIDAEEAMLEEWLRHVMSLGLDAVLGVASLAAEPGLDAFELAHEHGWTKWSPPVTAEKGSSTRSTFLKDAISRVYEERVAVAQAAAASPVKAVYRKMSQDRVAGFRDEIRTEKARPTYSRLPPSDERPMSDWQGASSELGFGPPVPPVQDWPQPLAQQHAHHPAATNGADSGGRDRFGSVATTGTNDTHVSPPHAAGVGPSATSPQPLPATVFGHGGPFGSASPPHYHHHKQHARSPAPTGLGITSPSGAPRINSAIPSSPLELLLPPETYGGHAGAGAGRSPMATPGAREVPAVLQLDLGKVVEEPMGTAERAVQKIREMGFAEEDAKRALRMTDIGDGLRVDRALELLLRE
ncbi:MAG: hypothetical protein M1822_001703 [Bathelium mastoideum]|nr:MAG: hypothetical protein M1822_001703 [Bathelium mastoideum]